MGGGQPPFWGAAAFQGSWLEGVHCIEVVMDIATGAVNECLTNNGGCDQVCTDTTGSFMCSCNNGFTLNNDERTCTDINECLLNTDNCPESSTCINNPGGFTCGCNPGFVSGGNCVDINECSTGTHNCQQTCTTTVGSFTCSCSSGFTINSDQRTCSSKGVREYGMKLLGVED